MGSTVVSEKGPVVEAVSTLTDLEGKIPELEAVPTGIPGLDELFFTSKMEGDRLIQVPLGGIPRYSVLQITGVADTGKSLMAEQFAVERARREETCIFVTIESPAAFVGMGLRARAQALGVDPSAIAERIILLDGVSHPELANDLPTLFNTLAYAIRTHRARAVVIDSLTGLFESREMLARDIVRPIFRFLKKWHQTALLVSQKRSSHEALTAEAAGGYAVGHILDGSLVLAKQTILSAQQAKLYGVPVGEMVRLFRIDGCRLCGHDTSTHLLEITPAGLVRIGPRLSELRPE